MNTVPCPPVAVRPERAGGAGSAFRIVHTLLVRATYDPINSCHCARPLNLNKVDNLAIDHSVEPDIGLRRRPASGFGYGFPVASDDADRHLARVRIVGTVIGDGGDRIAAKSAPELRLQGLLNRRRECSLMRLGPRSYLPPDTSA